MQCDFVLQVLADGLAQFGEFEKVCHLSVQLLLLLTWALFPRCAHRAACSSRQTLRYCLGKLARRCCWLKCLRQMQISFFCRSATATVRLPRRHLACDLP